MVRWWDAQIKKGIKLTESRIKHFEKHGMGKNAMDEKANLVKQKRQKELRGIK